MRKASLLWSSLLCLLFASALHAQLATVSVVTAEPYPLRLQVGIDYSGSYFSYSLDRGSYSEEMYISSQAALMHARLMADLLPFLSGDLELRVTGFSMVSQSHVTDSNIEYFKNLIFAPAVVLQFWQQDTLQKARVEVSSYTSGNTRTSFYVEPDLRKYERLGAVATVSASVLLNGKTKSSFLDSGALGLRYDSRRDALVIVNGDSKKRNDYLEAQLLLTHGLSNLSDFSAKTFSALAALKYGIGYTFIGVNAGLNSLTANPTISYGFSVSIPVGWRVDLPVGKE
jgi:hypothetical protein